MAGQANKLKIGLFVLVGFSVGIGLLIWLGASRYFERTRTVVAYFEESVQGLQRDSPVKFRGVFVGRVRAIRLAPDKRLVEVLIDLDQDFHLTGDLVMSLNLVGLTGKKYLEMDRSDKTPDIGPEDLSFEPPNPLIPTRKTDITKITNVLDIVHKMVEKFDTGKVLTHLENVSEKLDRMIGDPKKMEGLGERVAEAVREVKGAAEKINGELERMQPSRRVSKTLDRSAALLQELTETTQNANKLIRRTDNNINRLSLSLERSADHLEDFMVIIKNKPSLLLRGTPEKTER